MSGLFGDIGNGLKDIWGRAVRLSSSPYGAGVAASLSRGEGVGQANLEGVLYAQQLQQQEYLRKQQEDQLKRQQTSDFYNNSLKAAQLKRINAPAPRNIIKGADGFQYYQDDGSRVLPNVMMQPGTSPQQPSSVREWEYFQKLPPEQQKQFINMKRKQQFAIRDVAGAPNVLSRDETGHINARPLSTPDAERDATAALETAKTGAKERTKLGVKMDAEAPQARARLESSLTDTQLTRDIIGRIKTHKGRKAATGASGWFWSMPGGEASNVEALIETLRAKLGFQELAKMRAASPTGGALGQVTERELSFLQSAVQNLSVTQSEEQFLKSLDLIDASLQRFEDNQKAAFRAQYGQQKGFGQTTIPQNKDVDPLGIL